MKVFNYILSLGMMMGIVSCDVAETGSTPTARINAIVKTAPDTTTVMKLADHLTLTEAKMLVRDIEFESALDEDSLDFETGPIVLNLNLDGGVTEIAVAEVKPGIYDEIEFDIHKPEDNEEVSDTDFRIGDSGDERFSVVIRGIIDGEEFLFRSNENFDLEIEPAYNIEINENDVNFDITLSIDVSQWFMDEQGNPLDPRNFEHANAIDESIERSFDVFEDNDRDGDDDHEEDESEEEETP